jgi:hypothetical protein
MLVVEPACIMPLGMAVLRLVEAGTAQTALAQHTTTGMVQVVCTTPLGMAVLRLVEAGTALAVFVQLITLGTALAATITHQ